MVIVGACALTVTTLMLYFRVSDELERFFTRSDLSRDYSFIPTALAVAFACAGSRVRYSTIDKMLRRLMQAIGAGILVSLLLDPSDFALANAEAAGQLSFINGFQWPAVLFAAIGLVRPSFLLPPVVYLASARYMSQPISGMGVSMLDIRYLLDSAAYLSVFTIFGTAIQRKIEQFREYPWQQLLAMVAIGMHLGNYFWSAVAKIMVGPYPWSWLVENQTYNMTAYALENRTLPFGQFPALVDAVYGLEKFLCLPLNFAVLTMQAAAIVCVFRLPWMRLAAFCYDLLHIGIYLLGGIFFSAWIWNNIAVILAIRGYRSVSVAGTAACFLTILLGYPPLDILRSAWLGWFDLTNARQSYFEAVTDDGREVRVPYDAFLGSSHSVGHAYMANVGMTGQYPFTWWASGTYEQFKTIPHCASPPPVNPTDVEAPAKAEARLAAAGRMVRANHTRLLDLERRWGHLAIYFRLHHLPSNPFMFKEFNELDLGRVNGYNLVIASMCHDVNHGVSAAQTIGINKVYFDVQ